MNMNPQMRQRPASVSQGHNREQRKKRKYRKLLIIASILLVLLITVTLVTVINHQGNEDSRKSGLKFFWSKIPEDEKDTKDVLAEYTENSTELSADFSFTNGVLIDVKGNTVLASKDADECIFPASLTKVMTLIVTVENCDDLEGKFTMTAEILEPLILENASVAGFAPGEEVTVKDMLYGLILPSGADAAIGLAAHIAGSEDSFVELMNKKSEEMGLQYTHFINASGLHHDEHYSTCREMAEILRYAMENEIMREVLTTYQYTTSNTPEHPEGIELTSTMFSRMYGDEPENAFIIAGKTGYTLEAHHCLASFAIKCEENESEDDIYSRKGDYILVTIGSPTKWGAVFDAIDIYTSASTGKGISNGVVNRLSNKY